MSHQGYSSRNNSASSQALCFLTDTPISLAPLPGGLELLKFAAISQFEECMVAEARKHYTLVTITREQHLTFGYVQD